MHDNQSFSRIAREMKAIVRFAAEPVPAGETVKGQIRRAWEALGRPAEWRVRAAWHGEAGHWIAAAADDFRGRYDALVERRARQRAIREATEAARDREEAASVVARLDRLRAALSAADPDFYREDIAALGIVLGPLRAGDRA